LQGGKNDVSLQINFINLSIRRKSFLQSFDHCIYSDNEKDIIVDVYVAMLKRFQPERNICIGELDPIW